MSSKRMNSEYQTMMMESLDEAINHAEGKVSKGFRITRIEVVPPEEDITAKQIRDLRKAIDLTQVVFAKICNVGESTVQGWESGKNHPVGATKRLLSMFLNDNNLVKSLVVKKSYKALPEETLDDVKYG